jgi:hypothetical protein
MKHPVSQDKHLEHVSFQKSALELMKYIAAETRPRGNEQETLTAKMHHANIAAQTHIQFDGKQLLELIRQHLVSNGHLEAASALSREAGLPAAPIIQVPSSDFPPFIYQSNLTLPATPRASIMFFIC